MQDPEEPGEIAFNQRLVQPEVTADSLHGFGCCALSQNGLGKIARQQVNSTKNQDGDHEHCQQTKPQSLDNNQPNTGHEFPLYSVILVSPIAMNYRTTKLTLS